MDLPGGSLKWRSPYLGAGVAGGIALDGSSAYVGAENMVFYKLSLSDGSIQAQAKVSGQSFFALWPVVFGGKVYIETAPVPAIGSEYVGEEVMEGASSVDDEQDRWLQFLSGQSGFSGASTDWKHFTVLSTTDLSEPFTVPSGPFEGCGTPPDCPVIDNENRVLAYFKTKYAFFGKTSAFGTNYSIDISAVDQTTGRRIVIDNGQTATEWFTWETDNLYAMTVSGDWLYLRQRFRGTVAINLSTTASRLISVQYGERDGGGFWNADIIHQGDWDTGARTPSASQREFSGRTAPAIAGGVIYFTEPFCLVAAEHHQ
jgi:hypothetical protein